MTQQLIRNPSQSAAGRKPDGTPMSEGPLSKKDLLLRSISEQCAARFKSSAMEFSLQGPKCPEEAACEMGKDPHAEVKAVSLEMLPLKFDITREAYGTEDAYVVIKTEGPGSFFALHGLVLSGGEKCGISTLALRIPSEIIPEIVEELKGNPGFINEIFHEVVPSAAGISFSIKSRIDILLDRNYFISRLDAE
jgi:hypothetical protein